HLPRVEEALLWRRRALAHSCLRTAPGWNCSLAISRNLKTITAAELFPSLRTESVLLGWTFPLGATAPGGGEPIRARPGPGSKPPSLVRRLRRANVGSVRDGYRLVFIGRRDRIAEADLSALARLGRFYRRYPQRRTPPPCPDHGVDPK